MFAVPGSTQVLDRQTMLLMPCTPTLCRTPLDMRVGAIPGLTTTRRTSQSVNTVTSRVLHPVFLTVMPSASLAVEQAAYDFAALGGQSGLRGLRGRELQEDTVVLLYLVHVHSIRWCEQVGWKIRAEEDV